MMVVVRPWKLPSMTMMLAWSSGTPLTRYPQRRLTFRAVSTASAPVFIGRTMSLPVSSARACENGPSWSLWKARLVRVSRESWSWARASSRGCPWPKFSAEYPARQSRYRLPSTSVTQAPSPWESTTGNGW